MHKFYARSFPGYGQLNFCERSCTKRTPPKNNRAIFRLLLLLQVLFLSGNAFGQTNSNPYGFEDGVSSNWVPNGSSETVALSTAVANVRTGTNSLAFTTTSTSSNKIWYANTPYGASASGTYVHFIYWAKGADAVTSIDASMRYTAFAPPTGTGATANGAAVPINATGWTRISYGVGNFTNRWYYPSPRRTSGNATTFYMDDGIVYTSSSNITDLVDPLAPTALNGTVSGANVSLSWTSATDAGTGVQASIILRTTNMAATAPGLNDQAVYSVTGAADGPNTIGDWTVISATTGATAVAYTDNAVPNGTYRYAVVLRDLAYNYSTAAVSPAITVGSAPSTPVVLVDATGFTSAFGHVVMNTNSAPQLFTVSGSNLTAPITITAPLGFQVSTASAGGYGAAVTLTPVAGTVAPTVIYARFAPVTASGATGLLNITATSTGATTGNVPVNGTALAIEPTIVGTISFGTTTTNSMVLNLPTVGNGNKRIIVAKLGAAPTFAPTDAVTVTGVNANFTTATDQGSGNKIVYDGSLSGAAVVTVTGLTVGSTYYFSVFEYNEGTGASQNYVLTPLASGSNSTLGLPSPVIAMNQTGFNGAFGNAIMNTNTANQTYTVSGSNLTADIILAAPADFQISTAATAGFGSSLTLTQSAGMVTATGIYVRYAPTAATGASGNLNIIHTSTGAIAQSVAVSGNALAVEPTAAGTISFGTITANSIIVNLPTVGNGSKRLIVARAGSAVSFIPADASAPGGINANFSTAADQGSGNKIIYEGTGTGNGVVTLSGLSSGVTYHFAAYEYNEGTGTSRNYLPAPVALGNAVTVIPTPVITVTAGTFTGNFGNVVMGTNSALQQYTVAGINLTTGITITAPTGFQISTSSTTGFGSTLTLSPGSGTVATTIIYARYAPAAAVGATGSLVINHSSTGATIQNIGVNGNALAIEPTTNGTITFGSISPNSIVVNLPGIGNGNNRIIVVKQGIATSFTPTDGIPVTGVNADFVTATDQGTGNKIIYDGNGVGSNIVTMTGLSAGTQYFFTVYEYNVGTGTSQNYRLLPVATGNATTTVPVPVIVVNTTGFNGAFGKVAVGSSSPAQQYTVSGTYLTSAITITAPAGFEVSLNSTSGFGPALTLAQTAGMVAATNVFVRFTPLSAIGVTGNLTITNVSAPATTQSLTVNGTALAVEPSSVGTITFGTVTDTTIEINLPTVGNGSRRMIVASAGTNVSYLPEDALAIGGVDSNIVLATNQGNGDRIVYDGAGSGSRVVKVTQLTPGMLYYFTVYEYNVGIGASYNYLVNPAAYNNMTTSLPGLGVRTTGFAKDVRIYPNPVTNVLFVDAPGKIAVTVVDAFGRLIYQRMNERQIEFGALPNGYYLIYVKDDAGRLLRSEKILKSN